MKKLIKKWWFWIITLEICLILYIIISNYIENRELKDSMSNIGEGASEFIEGINNAESHLDEFSYNYETGEVEYRPKKITLEMYNRIKEGMNQEDVVLNLGKYDNKMTGDNTYILEWGDAEMKKGYWISIVFNKDTNTVFNKINTLNLSVYLFIKKEGDMW